MGLESVTYISDLVSTNPVAGDYVSAGDDHIRRMKTALLNTFPNITAAITATHTELNKLAGVTATTAELNKLAGVTATTAEINKLAGVTATTAELNKLAGVTATSNEFNKLAGVTATTEELNKLAGVTATTDELNLLADKTSVLSGVGSASSVTPESAPIQAATDGLVICVAYGNSSGNDKQVIYGKTDASTTPTTIMAALYFYGHQNAHYALGEYASWIMPVKSGDYYSASVTNVAGSLTSVRTYYWIPLG